MREEQIKLAAPEYLKQFSCMAGDCPDTCCAGWDIVFDEAACARYAADEHMRHELDSHVFRNTAAAADGSVPFARVRLTPEGCCPYLREDRLCAIQWMSEEENLSETCRTHPRVIHLWKEKYAEEALHISCPQAARLILESSVPMRFFERNVPDEELKGLRLEAKGTELAPQSHKLRNFVIFLLQQQEYALEDRIRLADHFLRRGMNLCGAAREKVMGLVHEYMRLLEKPEQVHDFLTAQGTSGSQLEILRSLIFHRLRSAAVSEVFDGLVRVFMERYQLSERQAVNEAQVSLYEADLASARNVIQRQYPFMLENYFVNQVFRELYFTGDSQDKARWRSLVFQFILQRALLAAAVAADGQLLAEAVDLMQKTAKAIEHNSLYLQQANDFLSMLEEGGIRML